MTGQVLADEQLVRELREYKQSRYRKSEVRVECPNGHLWFTVLSWLNDEWVVHGPTTCSTCGIGTGHRMPQTNEVLW